jgi:outer membrane receptor protein involved in Fe transport
MRSIRCLALLSLLTCLAAISGLAQTITATITGTVIDASGAVVPQASITATNTSTGNKYDTKANDAGVYDIKFLTPGPYTVTVESSGFKKVTQGPFTLEVNQVARVDVTMVVGQVTENIEVTGVAPILQTENAQTGSVISAQQATELPSNGRNFVALTLLVPGAITPNPGSMTAPSRQFSGGRPYVNGNREQSNNFLLDGVDMNEPIDNLIAYNPNIDALQEMQVLTGNASAEFGNGNGAIVNMTTKGGTNEFHGNVFEFLENDKLDANSFFNNRSGAAKRGLRQNQFGATFGGPIKRNKLFFFMDYQGTILRDFGTSLVSVPTAAMRGGNLAAYNQTIKDPATPGATFGGGVIPVSRIVNPVALALFANPALYPLPNSPGTGNLGVTNDYRGISATNTNNDQADARIDYRLRDQDSIFGRFTIERYRQIPGSVAIPTQLAGATIAPTTAGVINWTHTISPTAVNEARIGYTRVGVDANTVDPTGVLGITGNQKLGIPGSQPISGASQVTMASEFTNIGSSATDSSEVDNDYHLADNFSKTVGRHSLKMGANLIRYQENRFYAGNNGLLGNFIYNGTYTGVSFADFLLNDLNSKGRGSLTGKWGHRQWRDGLFFQDDWKVSSTFTVNLGLRWEYTQPVYEVADRQTNFNLATGAQLFAGQNGNSRALYNAYYKQFMPRLGLAWNPTNFGGRLVVRAGYGITSYMEGTGANLRLPLNPPFYFESAVQYATTAPGDIRTGFTDVQPQSAISGQIRFWNPDLRPAFIEQYNFSTEYRISNTLSLSTGYVGQKGTHLVDPREYNQPLPAVGALANATLQQRRPEFGVLPLVTTISGTDSSSTMNYNSLQVSARKRLSGGFDFVASYTLSKSLTDNLGYYGSGGVNAEGAYWQNAYNRKGDYGRAFFDARHNVSFGGTYRLPYGKDRTYGKNANGLMDTVFGGWKLDGVISAHSGFPVTITSTTTTDQLARGTERANQYGRLPNINQTVDHWFGVVGTDFSLCQTRGVAVDPSGKPCAYGVPATDQFGTAGKNTEQAPDFKNLDLSIGKQFHFSERSYFDLRGDFFNVLNKTNFGPPGRTVSTPTTFGQITSIVGNPRTIQLGLKFYF